MNRLREYFEEPPEPERSDDYFAIESHYDTFAVSRATAIEIERQLDQRPTPRWIVFRDLAGARHRVLASHIRSISESTAAQRAASREFDRARRLEEKRDRRPWEDD
jgi:hypothetical protein